VSRIAGTLRNVDPGPFWSVGFTLLFWIFAILHFRQVDRPTPANLPGFKLAYNKPLRDSRTNIRAGPAY
jgi:hypothetical protein